MAYSNTKRIIEEYITYMETTNGHIEVKSRITKSLDPNDKIPYNYQLDHLTTMGGTSGFYYKDYASASIDEVRDFMMHHLSLFQLPNAKHEKRPDY